MIYHISTQRTAPEVKINGVLQVTWSGWREITSRKGENRRKNSVRMCIAKRASQHARHKGGKEDHFPDVQPSECSSWCRDGNSTVGTHHNADAVEYE